jgi:hypothetical protein
MKASGRVAAGQAAGVLEDVDGAGVGAGRHHHLQVLGRVDLHDVEVVGQAVRGQPAVVQDRAPPPAREHGDEGREAVLGHQLSWSNWS